MTTPRNLEQAFGPYQRHGLPRDSDMRWTTTEVVVYVLLWTISAVLATLAAVVWAVR